jgi:hypothetical protein
MFQCCTQFRKVGCPLAAVFCKTVTGQVLIGPLIGMRAGTIPYRIEGDICKGVETVLSFGAGQKVLGRLHFGCRIGCN